MRRKRFLSSKITQRFAGFFRCGESVGYETVAVHDGLEDLSAARREKPDLVILDLMLPGMDGHKLCRLLKSDRTFRHIPVVIFTSRDLDEDAELSKQCGADGFIVKTTRAEIMLDVIKRLLDGRRTS